VTAAAATTLHPRLGTLARWVVALTGALVVFGVFMWTRGARPLDAYAAMWRSTFTDLDSVGEVLIRATPIMLAALAVAVPARAGLVNVGGEGQLVVGGIAAAGIALAVNGRLPGSITLVLMSVGAAAAGALWSGVAGVLRLAVGLNESVSTLLLNYVAIDLMSFLTYDAWKDPNGSGQPATAPLRVDERFGLLGAGRVHAGLLVAVAATLIVAFVLRKTVWGFRLRVVGGNAEAGRRAGLRVGALMLGAMFVGGALAGLGGVTQLAGAEFKLRPGFSATYGYVGFLASWFARHRPVNAAVAAVALSAIAIGGDSLQIDSGLPAASVNVLMALVLFAVFGWARERVAG